jgi:group I intron endonuclease
LANSNSNLLIHRAIRKYGIKNFRLDILYQSKDYQHTISVMEEYFIEKNQSHYTQHGYNLTWGGEGTPGLKHTKKSRKKMSRISKNNWQKPGRKERWSNELQRRWEMGIYDDLFDGVKNHFFNKHHTKKSNRKNALAHIGNKSSKKTKQKQSKTIRNKENLSSRNFWILQNPKKKIVIIKLLRNFCEQKGYNYNTMRSCFNRGQQYKSYTLINKISSTEFLSLSEKQIQKLIYGY